jgi:hypothetical protein
MRLEAQLAAAACKGSHPSLDREDEWFYIVEGQVGFLMNGTWTDVFPGTCIYSPRGSVHATAPALARWSRLDDAQINALDLGCKNLARK